MEWLRRTTLPLQRRQRLGRFLFQVLIIDDLFVEGAYRAADQQARRACRPQTRPDGLPAGNGLVFRRQAGLRRARSARSIMCPQGAGGTELDEAVRGRRAYY